MDKHARIFLAGGTGLVGANLLGEFRAQGYAHVLAPTRAQLNLLNANAVEAFFEQERPEYVILAAARAGGIKASSTFPAEFLFENLTIQNNVIWNAHRLRVRKLLFLGSSCVYPGLAPQPMKEEYLLSGQFEPSNEGYSIAKVAGLKLCEYLYGQYGQKFISCMPCNLYGPGDYYDAERGHVISSLLMRMHDAKESGTPSVTVWGTGSARREFLYVKDAAEALLFLMERYDGARFVNVGSGVDVTISELADLIRSVVGYQGKIVFDATKPEGVPQKLLNVDRMNALGWRARTPLEEGLRATYAEFVLQRSQLPKVAIQ
jgi:GDP-L-fucose synthase